MSRCARGRRREPAAQPARSRARPLLAAATLVAAGTLFGALSPATITAQGAGSGATTILRVAPGPRPLALGNAFAAVRTPLAVEYNPAALSGPAGVEASYQALPVEASAGAAVVALPVASVTMALSLRFLDYGDVAVIEPSDGLPVGQPTGEVATGGELSALLGAATDLGPLRLGLAGRWLRQDVAGLSDHTLAFDFGALLAAAPWLDLGVAVQHLGPDIEAGRAAPLPRTLRGGAAATGTVGSVDVLLTADVRQREERLGVGAGLEVGRGWNDGAAVLRFGYETRPDPGDAFSPLVVGGGVRLGPLSVELAWRTLGPLGATRQLGLGYRF